MADRTGVRLLLNIGMYRTNPAVAMEILKNFKTYIKDASIFAIEVGNEPDHLWKHGARPQSYTPQQFFAEYDVYVKAFRTIYPTIPLMGPGYAYGWREIGFQIPFIQREAQSTKYISFHRYQMRGCASKHAIADLLNGRGGGRGGAEVAQW